MVEVVNLESPITNRVINLESSVAQTVAKQSSFCYTKTLTALLQTRIYLTSVVEPLEED